MSEKKKVRNDVILWIIAFARMYSIYKAVKISLLLQILKYVFRGGIEISGLLTDLLPATLDGNIYITRVTLQQLFWWRWLSVTCSRRRLFTQAAYIAILLVTYLSAHSIDSCAYHTWSFYTVKGTLRAFDFRPTTINGNTSANTLYINPARTFTLELSISIAAWLSIDLFWVFHCRSMML